LRNDWKPDAASVAETDRPALDQLRRELGVATPRKHG
jgi:hypothetical protein